MAGIKAKKHKLQPLKVYYAGMHRKTRNDGTAFKASWGDKSLIEKKEPAIEGWEMLFSCFGKMAHKRHSQEEQKNRSSRFICKFLFLLVIW
jgi:hypothetical protein